MQEKGADLAAECRLAEAEGIVANSVYVVGRGAPAGGRQGEGKRGGSNASRGGLCGPGTQGSLILSCNFLLSLKLCQKPQKLCKNEHPLAIHSNTLKSIN